mgnify:CR=1 FL=1
MTPTLRLVPLALLFTACAPGAVGGLFSGDSSSGASNLNAALAQSYMPKQTDWVYKFWFLDPAGRTRACDEGYASASSADVDQPGQVRFVSTEGQVVINTSYGQTYLTCRQLGLQAEARPDSVPLNGPGFYLFFKNYLTSAQTAASAVFYDGSGKEIYRYKFLDGDTSYKYYSPQEGYTATYGIGLNTSEFDVVQKAAIARAASMSVQVNFGKGLETFTISQAKFPDLQ